MSNIQLKYIGNGAFLPNVPARDLTKEEVDQYGGADYLISRGLFVYAVSKIEAEQPVMVEEDSPAQSNNSKKKIKE